MASMFSLIFQSIAPFIIIIAHENKSKCVLHFRVFVFASLVTIHNKNPLIENEGERGAKESNLFNERQKKVESPTLYKQNTFVGANTFSETVFDCKSTEVSV